MFEMTMERKVNGKFTPDYLWNEWAEGGYLEPDNNRKYGFLEAVHDSLEELDELPDGRRSR